jgi:hypothetical protein
MSDLMQKLAISKKIMDKHNEVSRGNAINSLPISENVNVNYNIPNDMVEQPKIQETISTKPINQEAVLNSKLPDEIKKLMLENPISQPQLNGPTLSNEIVEGAARLMRNNQKGQENIQETNRTNTSNNDLKQMIRDVVRDTVRDVVKEELHNAGLISEGTQKTNETLSLRVGKHIFEGKVLKIKKVKQ